MWTAIGTDEVSVSAATSLSGQGPKLVDSDGSTIRTFEDAAANCPDQGEVVNLADYPSVGDLAGDGTPDVVKGGLTLNGVANLLAVNQNLPFCHVEQAWNAATGAALPGYPRATDDFQLLSQASIARVAGGGPQRQALVGTGLYQLHAYGPTGLEAPGWPKFTGGWTQSTPAVGDADGDGKLDVAAVTREGWSFLWKTSVPACGGSNNQWWTFHHDEHGTANHRCDGRPPGSPRSLIARRNAGGSVTVSWNQPGDDWLCGSHSGEARYQVLVSNAPIRHPSDGSVIANAAATGGPGQAVSRTFSRRPDRTATARCGALPRQRGQLGALAEHAHHGLDVRLQRPPPRTCTLLTTVGLTAGAGPAFAAFPYTRAGGNPNSFTDLYLNAGETPNDLSGDGNDFSSRPPPTRTTVRRSTRTRSS